MSHKTEYIWTCKIGGPAIQFQSGADAPMRQAAQAAFKQVTGNDEAFCFSGWGGELTEPERAVVENRLPSDEHEAEWNRRAALAAQPGSVGDMVMVPAEIVNRFPEINPSNYDHDDACALNAWGVELVLAVAHTEAKPAQQDKRLHVGDSRFEGWYGQDFDPKNKGTKQQMREAYEAGMNDPIAPAQQDAVDAAIPLDKDEVAQLIAEHLGGTYHCTRVWEAWNVGTMSQDDFEPVDESETPTEIADAIIDAIRAAISAKKGG